MKKTLSLAVLFGTLAIASAQSLITTNLYVEDWGTVRGGSSANTLAKVGWTAVSPAGVSGGPFNGIFSVPPNAVFFNDMANGAFGIFYTTDTSGTGTLGDSSFTDIDPTVFTNNLTFTVLREGSGASNYFAIQQGGQWYVSTTLLPNGSSYPNFLPVSMVYSSNASAWNTLTINAAGSGVTIGSTPAQNLSGLITGVGIVVGASPSGWNYTTLTISATVPQPPPTQTLYAEDWGAAGGGAAGSLAAVGWTVIDVAYTGFYGATAGSFDVGTGLVLSNRAMYLSMDGNDSTVGMAFTTDASGNGGQGDSTFADINPTLYPGGVSLNVETQASSSGTVITNFFAIQVGGNWYVAANRNTNNNTLGGPAWSLNTLLYTNNSAAANWNTLIVDTVSTPNTVTIGPAASAPLTGLITGVGLVVVQNGTLSGTTGFGFNYLNFTVTAALSNPAGPTAPVIDAPPFSQTAFATGTASFAVDAYVGTQPLGYTWTFAPAAGGSSVTIANGANGSGTGSFIIGATNNLLTISNLSLADAGTYSVAVANLNGGDNSAIYTTTTLTVNPLTNNVLYAETFPFVGPFPTDVSVTNVGWSSTIGPTLRENGSVYVADARATTVAFYTSSNTDVAGLSGVPFTAINPANYPFVSFRATVAAQVNPGNAAMYFAVETAGNHWYVSSSAEQLAATPGNFNTYGLQYSPVAAQWNNLTLTASSATIGTTPSANLSGNIIGAGLVLVFTTNSLYSMNSFEVVTNSTPAVAPTLPSEPNVPYPQTVYAGGGVGFSFTEVGTVPFTNSWELNDTPGTYQSGTTFVNGTNADGSIVSGATTTLLLLQNVQSGEQGVYSGWAFNAGGSNSTDSGAFGSPTLTVLSPPVGLIYNELFPAYSLPAGNINLTNAGWTLQADTPTRLFKLNGTTADVQSGTLAAYAFEGGFTNAVLFASTASDTGYSGLPFIAFDPANYPANSIQFSTSLAQGDGAWTNVNVAFAVKQGGQWYAYTGTPLLTASSTPAVALLAPASIAGNYTPFTQTYTNTASLWQTLTFTNTAGVLLGGTPAQNLRGSITAAGLFFQYFGAGGSVNLNSFNIQATGAGNLIGGVNIGAATTNGTVTLTWIGNAAVNLQSASALAATTTWTDVPNTLGQHSLTVNAGGVQKYYRLVMH